MKYFFISFCITFITAFSMTENINQDFLHQVKEHLSLEEQRSLRELLMPGTMEKYISFSNQDFKKQQQLAQARYMISCESEWDLMPTQQENALKEIKKDSYALTPIYIHNKVDRSKLSIRFKDQELTIDIAIAQSYFLK